MKNSILKCLVVLVTAVLASLSASATPTIYKYSGHITDIRDFNGTGIQNIVGYGTPFSGSFYYDPDAPFGYLIEPGRALFSGSQGPSVAVVGQIAVGGSSGEVQLFDNYNGTDMLFLPSVDQNISDLPLSLNGYVGVIRIQLYGPISNMSLPQTLNLIDFPGSFAITGYSSNAEAPSYFSWHVGGQIESLSTVPEPSTLALLGLVLAGLGLSRHRALSPAGKG